MIAVNEKAVYVKLMVMEKGGICVVYVYIYICLCVHVYVCVCVMSILVQG